MCPVLCWVSSFWSTPVGDHFVAPGARSLHVLARIAAHSQAMFIMSWYSTYVFCTLLSWYVYTLMKTKTRTGFLSVLVRSAFTPNRRPSTVFNWWYGMILRRWQLSGAHRGDTRIALVAPSRISSIWRLDLHIHRSDTKTYGVIENVLDFY